MTWPLVLPHPQVRRILTRQPAVLILTRDLRPGTYEIHDAQTIQRNTRHRKQGRPDLQTDPNTFTATLHTNTTIPILDLTLAAARLAGYDTLEAFYQDWLSRRRRIDPTTLIHLWQFQLVAEARYLHVRVHRAYTTNPAYAVQDEPQALSRGELAALKPRGQTIADAQRQGRSISIRLKDAARRGDMTEYSQLSSELAAICASPSVRAASSIS